jgi:hypothetical protein
MTLPSSGAISFGAIRTEAAFSGAVSMGDLYREGSKIPSSDGTSGIPTSGAISASNFYSKTIYPTFLQYVAGQPGNAKNLMKGYSLGSNLFTAGGSVTAGALVTGSGFRVLANAMTWNGSSPGINTLTLMVVVKDFANACNSSDINGNNASSRLQGKTLTVYNGVGTGGTVLFSRALTSVTTGTNGISATSPLFNNSANQSNTIRVNGGVETALDSTSNTYSFTIS